MFAKFGLKKKLNYYKKLIRLFKNNEIYIKQGDNVQTTKELPKVNILDDQLEYLENKIEELNNSIVYEKDIVKIYDVKKEVGELEYQLEQLDDFVCEYNDIQEKQEEKNKNAFVFSYRVGADGLEHFIELDRSYKDYCPKTLIAELKFDYKSVIQFIKVLSLKKNDIIVFQFEKSDREVDLSCSEYKNLLKELDK